MALAAQITSVFSQVGPFASVYLDASRADEHGRAEVELRWRGLRQQLLDAGAAHQAVAALQSAVGGHREIGGRHGEVLIATAAGAVCFDAVLPQPPLRESARWAPLPHLVPYLAQRPPDIACVLVVGDHRGADIYARTADPNTPGFEQAELVQGTAAYPLHKTARNDWSEARFQRRVDNAWTENAADVAAEAAAQVERVSARVVVVAGEERARALIVSELSSRVGPGVHIDTVAGGSRAAGASEQTLEADVQAAVWRAAWRQRREVLDRLSERIGRGERATMGLDAVLHALQRAQTETIVLSDDPTSTLTAWIGPEPTQLALDPNELTGIGVSDPVQDRFDAALLRALAAAGGDLVIAPGGHRLLTDGVAALLRYEDASTAH
jgi:hypothetical protein